MRGFQPQHFADGGLVQGLKRVFGMDEERNARVAAYRAQQAQEKAQQQAAAAPAPAPAPQRAITEYAGDSAMKRREKAAGLADGGTVKPRGFKAGGLIRGPGTGTSDSIETEKRPGTFIMPADSTKAIGPEALEELGEPEEMGEEAEGMEEQAQAVPVRLSNGEFEFSPEQVQALGEAVLTVMRDATHKAVGEGSGKMRAAGFAPAQAFSGGGSVRDPEELRKMIPQVEDMGYKQAPAAAPAPAESAASQVQNKAPTRAAAPFATTAPTSAGFMPGTRAVFNESGKAIGDLANQGRYAAAAGETARAALAYVPAAVDDVVGGAVRAVGPALADAGKQFLGMNEATAPAPAPTGATTTAGAGRGAINPTPVNPTQPATAAPAPTNAPTNAPAAPTQQPTNEVMPGVYQHGRGQYSDQAQGMGFAPGFTGKPSEQNMAAADALAQRSQAEAMNRVARGFDTTGAAPAAPAAPSIGGDNFDWMKDLRDPRTLALRNASVGSTIFRNKGEEMTANKARQARVAGVQAAIGSQMHDAQQAETERYKSDNTLAGTQEQANAQRYSTDAQAAESRRRGAIEAGKLGLEKEVRGFDIRAGQRNEALYQKYDAAKTPEEKSAIAQQIRDLSGKNTESPWKIQVTPATKNADGSTTDGSIYRYNTQTGSVERVDGGGARTLPPVKSNPAAQAIINNTSLTLDQRRAELQKLGYN